MDATDVNRSSLYATFGGKQELYLAALDQYLDEYALPGFQRLAEDPRGWLIDGVSVQLPTTKENT